MVKSVLGVSRQGLRDWFIQRVTAVVMVIYSIGLFAFFATHPNVTYYDWHSFFGNMSVKIVTLLFVLCLLAHAWIGMWTVLTDYVKPFFLRLMLYVIILLALVTFFFQALLILWGI
jgi:succinate dehydrogenase / fumarate reductase membrane anchor subunit